MGHTLVEDGATLQMGIGTIPNAVLASLGNHQVRSTRIALVDAVVVWFALVVRA